MRTLECDTFVAGGGVAGSAAAISSAECGASTILAEAGGTLGGQAAGTASALSKTMGIDACNLDAKVLRNQLIKDNVNLD